MEKVLGDYLLLQELGEGAFGKVFLAEHRFLKQKYALKVLSDELSSDKLFVERLEKEVYVLAKIDHPAIVKLHNISFAEGRYFLVMDAMVESSGEISSLLHYLAKREKPLSEEEVQNLLLPIASALDFAHSLPFGKGFLAHQGICFNNFFVKEGKDKKIEPLLADFGLSYLVGEVRSFQKISEVLYRKGDLENRADAFLAPEQKAQNISGSASDVYAFGVLAYYLIAREFPEGYFDLPSKKAPSYKLQWDLFLCNCLKKDPQKRPVGLVHALKTFLHASAHGEVLSWAEVEKKVENVLQMSFEFLQEEELLEKEKASLKNDCSCAKESVPEGPQPLLRPPEISRPSYDTDPMAFFHKDPNVSVYQPKREEIKEIEPLLTEMVIIPQGTYLRGSDKGARDEMPRHPVTLSSFALDIHPVTNEQFVRFLEAMGGEKDINNNDIIRLRNSRIKRSGGKISIESGYAKHPVVGVTWYGAVAYAKWIGKRLPFEAEWEIAACGGLEEALYSTGFTIDHSQANFFSSDTTSVKSYPANGYGLYDVVGNVYEWCQDWYAYNYYETSLQEPENPKGPPQGVYRVLRGGCWKSLKEDLRTSHRHRNNPGAVNSTYGFRCAADVL